MVQVQGGGLHTCAIAHAAIRVQLAQPPTEKRCVTRVTLAKSIDGSYMWALSSHVCTRGNRNHTQCAKLGGDITSARVSALLTKIDK
jgi:hypothetical protein